MTGIRWTRQDIEAALRKLDTVPAKPSKYRNKKTEVDGILFDSKKEAARYQVLKLMQEARQIVHLNYQVPFALVVNKQSVCVYVADFAYTKAGRLVVEDVKSPATRTAVYQLKKKLMRACYDIEIVEV